jgi:hypothetical protein
MSWAPVTPHTFAALDDLGVASNLNTWVTSPITNLNTGFGSATSYSATLTAVTTNPTGTYTTTSYYVMNGNLCAVWLNLSITGAFTAGSGIYSLSLPPGITSAITGYVPGGGRISVPSFAGPILAILGTSSTVRFEYMSSVTALASVTHAVPGAWTSGNSLYAYIQFPVA